MAKKKEKPEMEENVMRKIKIEKVVLNIGGVGEELEKGVVLLKLLTGKNPAKMMTRKRIPSLGIRPKLEVGAVSTVRKGSTELLKRFLAAVDNVLKKSQVSTNNFSFGIEEYIEIPGVEYQREIGVRGLDVTVVFKRTGRRVRLKKIKRGKVPERQNISEEEIIKFMEDNFQTRFE